jgi:hypothetical protein
MAGKTRLFEQVGGLLREVDPAKTDALRAKRPCRRMHLDIDVLLTDDEVAEMKAQAERAAEDKRTNAARAEAARQAREAAMKKLEALGITQNDIKLVLGLA